MSFILKIALFILGVLGFFLAVIIILFVSILLISCICDFVDFDLGAFLEYLVEKHIKETEEKRGRKNTIVLRKKNKFKGRRWKRDNGNQDHQRRAE